MRKQVADKCLDYAVKPVAGVFLPNTNTHLNTANDNHVGAEIIQLKLSFTPKSK